MGIIMSNGKNYSGMVDVNGYGMVQSGHTTYTLTGSNLEVMIPITFDIPFEEAPNITLSIDDTSRGSYYS